MVNYMGFLMGAALFASGVFLMNYAHASITTTRLGRFAVYSALGAIDMSLGVIAIILSLTVLLVT